MATKDEWVKLSSVLLILAALPLLAFLYGSISSGSFSTADAAAALAALAAGAALLIAYSVHLWHQRVQAVEIAEKWTTPEIAEAAKVLDGILRGVPIPAPISNASLTDEQKDAVRILLNHLQVVCIGVENGIYDEDMMHSLYGFIIVQHYVCFNAFIMERRATEKAYLDKDGAPPALEEAWNYVESVAEWWGAQRYGADRWATMLTEPPRVLTAIVTSA